MLRFTYNLSKTRRGRTYLLVVLAVGCLGWGLYASVERLRPHRNEHVRLGAGSSVARRFQVAQCLAGEAHKHGLDVEVVATEGFDDSMRRISDGRLEMAVVSSGLEAKGCDNARLLAGLDIAPLHILVRRELAESDGCLLEVLKGKRINLGEPGTNDRHMATDVLGFLRLKPIDNSGRGDFTALSLSKDDLSRLAEKVQSLTGSAHESALRELPDVVMTVGSLPGMVVQKLLDTGEYGLMPFAYAEPFLMSDIQLGQSPDDGVDRLYLEQSKIPAAMYLGRSPIPSQDCPTIGMRTLLVARADLSAATIKHVMQSVFESDFTRRIKPQGPREITTAYEIHSGAVAYLDANKPLLTGEFFGNISQVLSIFGAFSAGALSLYGYLRKRRIRRPGEYLEEIREVDALASGQRIDGDAPTTPEALASQLDTRLVKLKEQLIHDYCDNRVQGEMVLMSILSMLADSRTQLRRSTGQASKTEDASPHVSPRSQTNGDSPIQDFPRTPRRAA